MRQLRALIWITVAVGLLIVLMFGFMFQMPDSQGYIEAARMLYGAEGEDRLFRLTKPGVLLIPGLFGALGWQVAYGFMVQNMAAFMASAIVIFRLTDHLFKDQRQALVASVAYITAGPVLIFGLAFVPDMTGWFFGLLGIYLVVRDRLPIVIIGLIMAIGLTFKESAGVSIAFAIIYLAGLRRWADVAKLCVTVGILIGAVNLWVENSFGYNGITWFRDAHSEGYMYGVLGFVKQLARTFDVWWALFIIGAWHLVQQLRRSELSNELKWFCVAGGSLFLLFFFWPYAQDRIFYMVAPFVIVVASRGAVTFGKVALPLVLLGAVMNIDLQFLVYIAQANGMVPIMLLAYPLILGIVWKFWPEGEQD